MREHFLHYLWRMKKFDLQSLSTTEGNSIQILDLGEHNHNSGPDFINARIKIDDTLWAGNVEIHIKSSDWERHKHQHDAAYNNVVLHVVFEEDKAILRENKERIPCLELRQRIPSKLHSVYQKLIHNEAWIPCQNHFHKVSEIKKSLWLDRMLVDRLEDKTKLIAQSLKLTNNNWEESFYHFLARGFGVKQNMEAFEQLARIVPLSLLLKHKNNLLELEALFYGQSGLLDKALIDDYPNLLKKEYAFLKSKYNLSAMNNAGWKFMRMRPANFPTIRIAQFAKLIYQSNYLFSKVLALQTIKEVEHMFEVKISSYWKTHYSFDKESKPRKKTIGQKTIHLLIINTIVPFLFYYGQCKDDDRYKDQAIQLLEELDPEFNSTIKHWEELGLKAETASETQALLQLKNEYCNKKKCLNCGIGNAILSN